MYDSPAAWLNSYLNCAVPRVEKQLELWKSQALKIQELELKRQAVSSLEHKAFHCFGGSVMALMAPRERWHDVIDFIVAFQTVSDYLDNLCDRMMIAGEETYLRLHRAMTDAIVTHGEPANYYGLFPWSEEVYLPVLVGRCREIAASFPSLDQVSSLLLKYASYYSYLQAYKHIEPEVREEKLKHFIVESVPNSNQLPWWELAAAAGSTLLMFGLLSLAAWREGKVEAQAREVEHAYFPWICGLHILLDYLIDEEEDRAEGDLNFTSYYSDKREKWAALAAFVQNSLDRAGKLPMASLHLLVVRGLLAMYLSDPKVKLNGMCREASSLMKSAGTGTFLVFHICRAVRRLKKI